MFTGLIEAICTVKSVHRVDGAARLTVDLGKTADETRIGGSIAVNGTCLTVAGLDGSIASFDVSRETLTKSTLDGLKPGQGVNVELAMKAEGRFGGHIVAGHIDGVAVIKAIERQSRFANIKFAADAELLDQMVVKGSVAIDGISLTIAGLDQSSFSVAIIPQTLAKTTLGSAKVGDEVNIEIDIIAKMVKKQLEMVLPQKEKLTIDKLKQLGF